jgi:NAD-dependent deacetylase
MTNVEEKIEHCAELINESENVVALTGAGMSTESGIPDFRTPGSGLWTKVDPGEIASISSYVANPGKNMKFLLELGMQIFKAKPNEGHRALTRLQKMGRLEGVMTQNIDGLHQRAHTKNVIELHGTANEAKCMKCDETYPITVLVNQIIKGDTQPTCKKCNGILKPNAVFFGEALESDVLQAADRMVGNCDLLIVLGSSLLVYPVAFYPQQAKSCGAKLAIINIQETPLDAQANIVIHKKIGKILPKIVDKVENGLK